MDMRFDSYLKRFAVIFLVLMGLSVLQVVHCYPRLPDRVASHFNLQGEADGWMSKGMFCAVGPIVLLISVIPISAVGLAMCAFCAPKAAPPAQVTDDQQQADAERKREGQEMLADVAGSFGVWLGLLTGAFLLAMMQLAFQANLRTPPVLEYAPPALIAYLAAIGVLGVWKGRQAILAQRLLPRREIPAGVWFPAKRFGWGWGPPVCWQGWVAMIAWLGVFFIGLLRILHNLISILLFSTVMIVVLIALCWWKGERPRWRWGE